MVFFYVCVVTTDISTNLLSNCCGKNEQTIGFVCFFFLHYFDLMLVKNFIWNRTVHLLNVFLHQCPEMGNLMSDQPECQLICKTACVIILKFTIPNTHFIANNSCII